MNCYDNVVVDKNVGWRIKWRWNNQQPSFLRLGLGV